MLGAALVLALAAMEPREAGRPALSTRLRAHVLDPATLRELGMQATFAAGDRILVPRSAFETLRRRGVPPRGRDASPPLGRCAACVVQASAAMALEGSATPVSYTHLTLPTICSV